MKSFVTGATGFVGSAVVNTLLNAGHEVRVLARTGSDRTNIQNLDIEVIEGSLEDAACLDRCLLGMDYVFHVAADYRLWVPDPEKMFKTNVDATKNLMQLCLKHQVQKIVYTSSVATLGVLADGNAADENTPASFEDMIGPYKQSKYMAEQEVGKLIKEESLPAVLVYPSAPVGPRDVKPTPTGQMILDAAMGRMPAYVDTGLNIVHVDDVAQGHLLALQKGEPGDRFILGEKDMTLQQILQEVARLTGKKAPKIKLPHNIILPIAYVAETWARISGGSTRVTVDGVKLAKKKMFFSSDYARKKLGYCPRPAVEAIADAIDWFKSQGYC